jgi:MFS family permease
VLAIASVAGMFIGGVTNPTANGPLISIVPSMVKPEMQGRVMGLINTFATGITPISLIVARPISDAIGIRTWFWVAGIIPLALWWIFLVDCDERGKSPYHRSDFNFARGNVCDRLASTFSPPIETPDLLKVRLLKIKTGLPHGNPVRCAKLQPAGYVLREGHHICGLQSFWAFLDGKLNFLFRLEFSISIALNGAEVYKHIFTILAANKTIALSGIEPFNGSNNTFAHLTFSC